MIQESKRIYLDAKLSWLYDVYVSSKKWIQMKDPKKL